MLKEGRSEPAQRAIEVGGADERVLNRQCSQGVDLGPSCNDLPPSDLSLDPVEYVAAIRPRLVNGPDHAAEQPHELADLPAAGLVLTLAAAAPPGEQRADHLVEHIDGGVAQAGFELNELGDHGRSPAADTIAAKQEGWRDGAFASVLFEAPLMDRFGDRRINGDRAHVGEAFSDRRHARGARRFRDVAQPGQRRLLELGVVVQQLVDALWYASDLVKATEYGGEYPAILMIDTVHAKRTWLELPVDAPPEAHAAARAFAPVEPLTSADGSHVFYSRLPPQDSARTSAYERHYAYCISGDPSEALLGYVLFTNGGR